MTASKRRASVGAMRLGPAVASIALVAAMAGAGPGRAPRPTRPSTCARPSRASPGECSALPDLRRRRPRQRGEGRGRLGHAQLARRLPARRRAQLLPAAARGPRLRRSLRGREPDLPAAGDGAGRGAGDRHHRRHAGDGVAAGRRHGAARQQGHGPQPARLGPRPVRPAPAGRAVRRRQRPQDRRRRRQGPPQRLARGDRDPLEGARLRAAARRSAAPTTTSCSATTAPTASSAAPGHDILWGDWDPSNNNTRQKDVLDGGPGNDWLYPSHGSTVVKGGAGKDYVWAYYGRGTIDCGPGQGHRAGQAQRAVEAAQLRARPALLRLRLRRPRRLPEAGREAQGPRPRRVVGGARRPLSDQRRRRRRPARDDRLGARGALDGQRQRAGVVAQLHAQERAAAALGLDEGGDALARARFGAEAQDAAGRLRVGRDERRARGRRSRPRRAGISAAVEACRRSVAGWSWEYGAPSSRLEVKGAKWRKRRSRIGEVARRAGLRTSAIRYYESVGLLPEPPRESGQRRYGDDTLRRLQVIEVAKRAGFSLDEARVLLATGNGGPPAHAQLRELAERKLPEVDELIARAQAMRAWLLTARACECETLDVCGLFDPEERRTQLRVALVGERAVSLTPGPRRGRPRIGCAPGPASRHVPSPPPPTPAHARLTTGDLVRVLLVEDDHGDAFLVSELLREEGGARRGAPRTVAQRGARPPGQRAVRLRPARPRPARRQRPGRARAPARGGAARRAPRPHRRPRRPARHRGGRRRRAGLPRQGQRRRRRPPAGDPLRRRAPPGRQRPPAAAGGRDPGRGGHAPGARAAASPDPQRPRRCSSAPATARVASARSWAATSTTSSTRATARCTC